MCQPGMALASLPPLQTAQIAPDGSSSDPEGASPTSSATEMEFYCPHSQQCVRVQRPYRKSIKWLLRRLKQVQGKANADAAASKGPSDGSQAGLWAGCRQGQYNSSPGNCHPSQQVCHLCEIEQPTTGEQRITIHCAAAQQQQVHQHQDTQQQQEPKHQSCQPAHELAPAAEAGPLRRLIKRLLRQVVRFASKVWGAAAPQGPGSNDNSPAERIINVITSLPFVVIGLHSLRSRRCPKGRCLSWSFIAVGIVAAGYHGTSHTSPMRPSLRKLDYWTICYASNTLRRAVHVSVPSVVQIAAALIVPLKPTLVIGVNLALVEYKYLRHALEHAHLMPSFRLHISTALVGLGCFAFEDAATGMHWPPVLHSLWHCLSALAMGCTNNLVHHLELPLLLEGVQVAAA